MLNNIEPGSWQAPVQVHDDDVPHHPRWRLGRADCCRLRDGHGPPARVRARRARMRACVLACSVCHASVAAVAARGRAWPHVTVPACVCLCVPTHGRASAQARARGRPCVAAGTRVWPCTPTCLRVPVVSFVARHGTARGARGYRGLRHCTARSVMRMNRHLAHL